MRQYRHRRTENPHAEFPNPIEPGELAVNTANLQLVVGDAAFGLGLGAPLPLLPVRFFRTTAAYAIGDLVVEGSSFYRADEEIEPGPFDIDQWTVIGSGGGSGGSNLASDIIFVPGSSGLISTNVQDALVELALKKVWRAGDTMTGFLTLHAAPLDVMHAVNKGYIDALVAGGLGGGRKSAMVPWAHVNMTTGGGGGGGIEEAPQDGIIYGRQNAAWTPAPGFGDAPADGQTYGRRNNNWVIGLGGVEGEEGPYVQKIGDRMTGDLQMTTDALVWSASGAGITSVTAGGMPGHKLQICDSGVSLFEWENNTWVGGSLVMNALGALICTWGAKPGGGEWASLSDARIKTVHGDYTRGLADVTQLHPVLYNYIGNDSRTAAITPNARTGGVPYNESETKNATDKTFAGLIAQEAELVMPEMVTQREGYVDGVLVTDMRDLDTTPLLFAMINAIKELKARIEVLEAA